MLECFALLTQISVSNAGVEFGATRIFEGITFTVGQGERWAILGRNGSGKTTLFRLINTGTVTHEAQLYVFKAGISADSGRALLGAEHFPDSLADSSGAVLIAAAGATAPEQVYIDLQPGRLYALRCQFRDSATAPRHDRMGMFRVLQVANGAGE